MTGGIKYPEDTARKVWKSRGASPGWQWALRSGFGAFFSFWVAIHHEMLGLPSRYLRIRRHHTPCFPLGPGQKTDLHRIVQAGFAPLVAL